MDHKDFIENIDACLEAALTFQSSSRYTKEPPEGLLVALTKKTFQSLSEIKELLKNLETDIPVYAVTEIKKIESTLSVIQSEKKLPAPLKSILQESITLLGNIKTYIAASKDPTVDIETELYNTAVNALKEMLTINRRLNSLKAIPWRELQILFKNFNKHNKTFASVFAIAKEPEKMFKKLESDITPAANINETINNLEQLLINKISTTRPGVHFSTPAVKPVKPDNSNNMSSGRANTPGTP